jgi:hypothetical protein
MWQGGFQRRSHSKTTFPEMQKPNGEIRLDVLNVLHDVDICCATFKSILTMLCSMKTDESAMDSFEMVRCWCWTMLLQCNQLISLSCAE